MINTGNKYIRLFIHQRTISDRKKTIDNKLTIYIPQDILHKYNINIIIYISMRYQPQKELKSNQKEQNITRKDKYITTNKVM